MISRKNRDAPEDQRFRRVLSSASSLLNSKDKTKIYLVTAVQFFLAILDLIAVSTIGIVTALALAGIQSKTPPEQIAKVLDFLQLESLTFQRQVAVLGSFAAIIMVSKTLASVFLVRRMLEFLAHKSASISARLSVRVMQFPYEYIKRNSSQSILFSVTQGVNSLILGVVGSTVQIIAESSLIIIMLIGLLALEPIISIGALLYFVLISFFQQRILGSRAVSYGRFGSEATVIANQKITEALSLYREIYVRQALENYSIEISQLRQKAASVTARNNFLPYISKYTLEISLVLGALLLSASQFVLVDSMTAITTLSIFLAAATRVSPSILRLQQSLINIKANIGSSSPTLKLLQDISEFELTSQPKQAREYQNEIEIQGISFKYQDSNEQAILNVSLKIKQGQMVAFIGPSGGGKSTLVDLILGLLQPQEGEVLIRGMNPRNFVESSPGRIGFVAQDTALLNGTIRENLVLV